MYGRVTRYQEVLTFLSQMVKLTINKETKHPLSLLYVYESFKALYFDIYVTEFLAPDHTGYPRHVLVYTLSLFLVFK